jgi:hypothetical protein
MGRDTIIQFYTTDENEEWLSEQADASGQSLSEYCHAVIADHIDREQERWQYGRYGVDQQIELILNEIRDETTEVLSDFESEMGTHLNRIQRLRTVYVIAIWRLVKQEYSVSQREAALKHGADHVGLDPEEDPEIQSVVSAPTTQPRQPPTERGANEDSNTGREGSE